jgi:hypothetical protein
MQLEEDGTFRWGYQFGTEEEDVGREAIADDDGNIFIAGTTYADIETNINAGGMDIFFHRIPVKGEYCIRGRPCSVQVYAGENLQNGDKIRVLEQCGKGDPIPGFGDNANNATTEGATNGGKRFTWGGADPTIRAEFGTYLLCWCPGSSACTDSSDFPTQAGIVEVWG